MLAFGAMPGRCCFLRVTPSRACTMLSVTVHAEMHHRSALVTSCEQDLRYDAGFACVKTRELPH